LCSLRYASVITPSNFIALLKQPSRTAVLKFGRRFSPFGNLVKVIDHLAKRENAIFIQIFAHNLGVGRLPETYLGSS
jgi:hypothetical protein